MTHLENSHEKNYRTDIEGLRGLSVLFVILFHYDIGFFSGGFVGVDIFFVISGFLITGIITKNVHNKSFNIVEFYLRRARRLLPSYLIVLFGSFLLAAIYFSPLHFERFSEASLYALVFASNIFYIGEVGYFDLGAQLKPLLHTWSLGVEWQFYLIWPITLFFFFKFKKFIGPLFLVLIFLSSILGAVAFDTSLSSYYVPVFRFYEFMIGALAYAVSRKTIEDTLINTTLLVFGLGLILVSVFFFKTTMPFPSGYGLLPSVGAALVIHSCPKCPPIVRKMFENKVIVSIGTISYPLYLVHWPVLVFFQYATFSPVSPLEKTGLISASFVMAFILSKFVDIPIRNQIKVVGSRLQFNQFRLKLITILGSFVFFAVFPALAYSASYTNGWGWRFSSTYSDRIKRQLEDGALANEAFFETHNKLPVDAESSNKKSVLIVGDSHSKDLFNALSQNRDLFQNDYVFYTFNLSIHCHMPESVRQSLASRLVHGITTSTISESCKAQKVELLNLKYAQEADIIIVASRWHSSNLEYLDPTVKFFKAFPNADIILWGALELPIDPVTLLTTKGPTQKVARMLYNLGQEERIRLNETLSNAARRWDIRYYDVLSTICRDTVKECMVFDSSGTALFMDDNHWTFEGQKYFGSTLSPLLENVN